MRFQQIFLFFVLFLTAYEAHENFNYPIRNLNLDEYKIVSRAFYQEFGVGVHIETRLKCYGKFLDEANQNLKIAIADIQDIREEKVLELLAGLQHYRNYIMQTIYDSRPCVDINKDPEILQLRKIVENIDWKRLVQNLARKFPQIMKDFVSLKDIWNQQNLPAYGKLMGVLIRDCLAL